MTLGTKDPAEARVRHAKASAEVEARWANLRAGTRSLTERECHALAVQAHDAWLRLHADEPSQQFAWHPKLYRDLWTKTFTPETPTMTVVAVDGVFIKAMRRFCFVQADNCLAHHGLRVDDDNRLKLAKAIGAAFQRASVTLDDLSKGVIAAEQVPALMIEPLARSKVPNGVGLKGIPSSDGGRRVAEPSRLTMTGLFEAWWREAQASGRKPSTHESYRNTVRGFVAFLKHDDATRVTPQDVVAFKDYRLSTPSPRTGKVPSAKTVKDSDLSALKTLFGWAVMNHKLPMNPAAGLTIKVGRQRQTRTKGFTEAEARAILTAALAYVPGPKELPQTAAAKRWVPWLCAFSGARVGEIAQLRRQDLRQEGDFWVLHLTPEAGTIKTNEARDVVLHSQLIEQGFPAFVGASKAGPLFLKPRKDGDVLGPLSGLLNRLREFVREIVSDPQVAPNHGWRHFFTTMSIDAGIETRVYNAIQGHAGRTVADHYGDVTLKAKAAAIGRLPAFSME